MKQMKRYQISVVIKKDAEGDEQHANRNESKKIKDATRKPTTKKRLSKEERNTIKDVEWGLMVKHNVT